MTLHKLQYNMYSSGFTKAAAYQADSFWTGTGTDPPDAQIVYLVVRNCICLHLHFDK